MKEIHHNNIANSEILLLSKTKFKVQTKNFLFRSEDRVSLCPQTPSVNSAGLPERQTSEERQMASQEDNLLRLIVLLVFLVCSVFIVSKKIILNKFCEMCE